MAEHIVVDGRVFATEAADRGMGRYVNYLVRLIVAAGHRLTVLIPSLDSVPHVLRPGVQVKTLSLGDDPMSCTTNLNRFLGQSGATIYLDATPFLEPARYDVHACPVVAVLYDLIPMRFPTDYFGSAGEGPLDVYVNGLARVRKADQVIAISEYVKGHALRYLGIPRDRVVVIEPGLGQEYLDFARDPDLDSIDGGDVVCIQGAHRSKNFPAAIRFLERLSAIALCNVDIVVPTHSQFALIEDAHQPDAGRIRILHSLSEERKFVLQTRAKTIAHLSLDEGYGIPLAEALYLYRPLLCIDNAINRELVGDCDDLRAAGVLFLQDPTLESDGALSAAVDFVRKGHAKDFVISRRRIIDRLIARYGQAASTFIRALDNAKAHFDLWHARAGLGVVAPTEIGSCGVSDYCHALMRGGSPRYAIILNAAPRELQLTPHLRLLPAALLDDARDRTPGVLFNLAVSDSLTRGFDAIADGSAPGDVLVIHDAGSYLPGLLMQAAASGDKRLLFDRYLSDEPDNVRALALRWLAGGDGDPVHSDALFLEIDRMFRSNWLRSFRGSFVSHHAAFAHHDFRADDGILALLPQESVIRTRTRYAPMPIDVRATPGATRLAGKMRWALGLARQDLLVCCAGSVVRGKHLEVVARVVARINGERRRQAAGRITLMLAGRVLDDALFTVICSEFVGDASRLAPIVETNETRYDALLLASDVVVSFREQRRIQMSHSYVRALALGRPIVTNAGAGFDDADAAAICSDDHLERDLESHLLRAWDDSAARLALATASQAHYRARHTVDAFFCRLRDLRDVAAAI